MDYQLFGDSPNKRRKEINLGGSLSHTTHADIIQDARLRRLQRDENKRRQDAVSRIQAAWAGYAARRNVKQHLRATFDQDLASLTGLRCLVLLGQDQDALGRWSTVIMSSNTNILLQSDSSWLVLLQRVSTMLLRSLAIDSSSQFAQSHLAVLNTLLSQNPNRASITRYLVSHGFYSSIRHAMLQIPVPVPKASPLHAPLATLLATSLATSRSNPDLLPLSLREFILAILTIPLFPNRILHSLGLLTPHLPLASFHLVSLSIIDDPQLSSIESKVHLLANLAIFMPSRYASLPMPAFTTYLQLASLLLNSVPTHALEPPENKADLIKTLADDSDDELGTRVEIVSSFESKPRLPQLDERTRKRLQELPSPSHVSALLNASQNDVLFPSVVSFLSALTTAWPSRRDKVLSTIVIHNRGALVRELFRRSVRSSPLGRDDQLSEMTKPEYAAHWPPLLLLADAYAQALVTMGDDEFFSTGTNPNVPRNPLTLDEIAVFSRKLLNVAFALYWREDPSSSASSALDAVPGLGQVKWENVRDTATKCLVALHARDSRRPFTPPNHWLVTSQIDVKSFIQAAILEEKQLSQPEPTTGRALAKTKRDLAYFSPRMGVLNNIPFAIPFDARVSIFRHFVLNDLELLGHPMWGGRYAATRVVIRREHIAQDGFDRLGDVDLKQPIQITFMDQWGEPEMGIDGGGVFKEFLTSLCKEVFDTDRGLWKANKKNELYPAPSSYATEAHNLAWYKFIGRILGKALYDGILVDVAFAGFFLAKWLGKQSWLDDLASLDPELYQGLIFLKHYTGDPKDLSLDFTATDEEFGVTQVVDLIPNGGNTPVTRENRLQYITLMAHYRLTKQIKKQSAAFFEGLSDMIDPKWLRMFNQQELQILLGGVNSPIDLEDLRKHTQYGGLYDDNHPTIQMFWQVVGMLNHDERRKLLRFATSCSRPPLLGFKELNPNFAIRDATSDENRLPTASTCVNLLKLPRYSNIRTMREKLLQAINSNAGFDLS